MDHLGTLNDETARIKVGPDHPIRPEVIFGLDTALWSKSLAEGEEAAWADLGGKGSGNGGGHVEEVETATVWRGGSKPGSGSGSGKGARAPGGGGVRTRGGGGGRGTGAGGKGCGHDHVDGGKCGGTEGRSQGEGAASGVERDRGIEEGDVRPILRETLEAELAKLSFEIYRGEYHDLPGRCCPNAAPRYQGSWLHTVGLG